MLKKLISLALVICMLLSLAGFSAMAEEEIVDTSYLKHNFTYFVDDDFEDGVADGLKAFNAQEGEYTVGSEEEANGNKYITVKVPGTGWKRIGYTFPEITTGKLEITMDTYLSDLSKNIFYYVGKHNPNKTLLIMGMDSTKSGYALAGRWDRRGDNDPLCFGKLEPNHWYSYSMVIDIDGRTVDGVMKDRDTGEIIGTASDKLGGWDGYYGGMPDPPYYDLMFNLHGCEIGLDNVKIKYLSGYPKTVTRLVSDSPNNVFSKEEAKALFFGVENKEEEAVTLSGSYEIYDRNYDVIAKEEIATATIKPKETANIPLKVNADKYGVYYVKAKIVAEAEFDGEKQRAEYETDYLDFSIANILLAGESKNKYTSICTHMGNGRETPYNDRMIEAMAEAGFGNIRSDHHKSGNMINGYFLEEKGKWPELVHQHGMTTMPIMWISASNPKTGEYEPLATASESALEDLYKWADWYSKNYKDYVEIYEIGNEPIYGNISGKVYAEKVVKPYYEIIKKNDPESVIIVSATFGGELYWFQDAVDAGMLNYCDGLVLHTYDNESGVYNDHWRNKLFRDRIDEFNEYLAPIYDSLGIEPKPIYATEVGQTTSLNQASQKGAAAVLVQQYATHLAMGIESTTTYTAINTYADTPATVANQEAHFGLLKNWEDDTPLSANPSYVTATGYNKMLANAQIVGKFYTDKGTTLYKFKRTDGKDVVLYWTDYGSETVGLDLGVDSVEMLDMYTNSLGTLNATDGKFTITGSFEPVYLVGNFDKFEMCEPQFTTNLGRINLVNGDLAELYVRDNKGRELTADISLPKSAEMISTATGAGETKFSIKYTYPETKEESEIMASLYDGDKMVYNAKGHLILLKKEMEVSSKIETDRDGRDKIIVTVENIAFGSTIHVDVTADLQDYDLETARRIIVDLKPGQIASVEFDVPKKSKIRNYFVPVKVTSSLGMVYETTLLKKPKFTSSYVKEPPEITGKLDMKDWEGGDWFYAYNKISTIVFDSWGGKEDLSFKGTVKWDYDNMYLYCEALDNDFYQGFSEGDVWQNDNIQLGLENISNGTGDYPSSYTEAGISKTPKGNQFYRWTVQTGSDAKAGLSDKATMNIERVGAKTIYRVAIPWGEIFHSRTEVRPNDILGFSMLMNDNLGTARAGLMQFASGVGRSKDASEFAEMTLVGGEEDAPANEREDLSAEFKKKAMFAENPPSITGDVNIAEWQGGDWFTVDYEGATKLYENWGGPEDCSYTGTVKWDYGCMYLYCEVTDNDFYQGYTGSEIWKNDSLQIGMENVSNGTTRFPLAFTELGMALTSKGNQMYRYSGQTGSSLQLGNVSMATVNITRNGNKTLYRASIPWSELFGQSAVKEGNVLGFSLLVNDNLDKERGGFVEYNSGIGVEKDASRFGQLTLVK